MKLNILPQFVHILLIGTLALFVSGAYAGHYYEAVTTNKMPSQGKGGQMVVHSWVDGDKARVEFHSGEKDGWMAEGNYLITSDGGENVYLVDPGQKTYSLFSFEKMMASLGQAMEMMKQFGAMMKFEFTDVSTEKLLEEAGEPILGIPTTHYRFKSHYVMNMSVMGMTQTNTTDMVQDLWSTDKLDGRGFTIWLRPDRGLQTGDEGLDELFNQEMGKIKGFPLKIITDSTMTDKDGKQHKNYSSTEVTVLREESIPDASFQLPEGYTETSLIPELDEMQSEEGQKKMGGFMDMLKR